ncbi:MAG: hypothetical protein Tsb002_08190 [Wenzhouxiangellaceae bacterium]
MSCALLSCGGASDLHDTHPLLVDGPDDDRGVAALRVIINASQLSEFFPNWNRLVVQQVATGKLYSLQAVESGWSSTALLVGVLPEGIYRTRLLRAVDGHSYSSAWRSAATPPSLPHFAVTGGQLTDLGALVYQPLAGDSRSQPQSLIYRDSDRISVAAVIAELFPRLHRAITATAVSHWLDEDPTIPATLPPRLQTRIHAAATISGPLNTGLDGEVLLPARMGQIHARSASGHWRTYDTGLRLALHHVALLPDGQYMATGESGIILTAPKLSGPWQLSPGPRANASALRLIQLDQHASSNGWYQLTRIGHEDTVVDDWLLRSEARAGVVKSLLYYTPAPLTQPDWRELNAPDNANGVFHLQADRIHYRSNEGLYQYDPDHRNWSAIDAPPFTHYQLLGMDSAVAYDARFRDLPLRMAVYRDGHNWQTLDGIFPSSLPVRHGQGFYVVARASLTLGSGETVPELGAQLYFNDLNQAKWWPLITMPELCTLQARLYSLHNAVWAQCAGSQIFRFSKNGWILEWQPELETADFQPFAAPPKTTT